MSYYKDLFFAFLALATVRAATRGVVTSLPDDPVGGARHLLGSPSEKGKGCGRQPEECISVGTWPQCAAFGKKVRPASAGGYARCAKKKCVRGR